MPMDVPILTASPLPIPLDLPLQLQVLNPIVMVEMMVLQQQLLQEVLPVTPICGVMGKLLKPPQD